VKTAIVAPALGEATSKKRTHWG